MDKSLTVYPISTGDELNIFANEAYTRVTIMDMHGSIVYHDAGGTRSQSIISIGSLPAGTYIVEVLYCNLKKARSVFVKM